MALLLWNATKFSPSTGSHLSGRNPTSLFSVSQILRLVPTMRRGDTVVTSSVCISPYSMHMFLERRDFLAKLFLSDDCPAVNQGPDTVYLFTRLSSTVLVCLLCFSAGRLLDSWCFVSFSKLLIHPKVQA